MICYQELVEFEKQLSVVSADLEKQVGQVASNFKDYEVRRKIDHAFIR